MWKWLSCVTVAAACAGPPSKLACTDPAGCVVTLADGQGSPNTIAVDPNAVYWNGKDGIMKSGLDGAGLTQLVAGSAAALAIDDTYVYWTDGAMISRVAKAGGAAQVLASGGSSISALAVDANAVYFTAKDELGRVAKTGGAATMLAPIGQPYPFQVAVDATAVYWVDTGDTTVNQVGFDGGAPTRLATARSGGGIAVDDAAIYWASCTGGADGGIVKLVRGATTLAPLSTDSRCPLGITLDDNSVYWTDYSGSRVMRTPLAGGTTDVLAADQPAPSAIAVDATSVYWTDVDAGTVMVRTPK